jgi:lipid II isoglutaminyl synthase (glutamine-hydrolysing)
MTVRIALVLPELLGTYGDSGNATVLLKRLAWRNIPAELVTVRVGEPVPDSCDIYLLGGGEDLAQLGALARLRAPGLARAAAAVVFAVCAGFQILGESFVGQDDIRHHGLGLFDATSTPMPKRAVGELLVRPDPDLGLGTLTGFENHRGATRLGRSATPLGTVTSGVGNGVANVDGAIQGRMIGTYLHGPALARNPALADLLLSWATGSTLAPLKLAEVDALRDERVLR